MAKHFFLPWQGEFGCFITSFIRAVHTWPSEYKVVACRPGYECLFPTANEFFFDYSQILPDRKKRGRSARPWVRKRLQDLEASIRSRHPEYAAFEFVLPFMKYHCYRDTDVVTTRFRPVIAEQGLATDVVITPRNRRYVAKRNLPFWQEIVDALKQEGYSVGIVGHPDTTVQLQNVDLLSWHHGDMEPSIDLIRNSKIVLAQNTGVAHLCVFLAEPMLLMLSSKGMLCWMEAQRDPNVFFKTITPDPVIAVRESLAYLRNIDRERPTGTANENARY
ncbi:MAG TPA: hypothetical protein VMY37_30785 [Thermoguttaceae bacterium]|nr:hypothetical protein [Thermoguttaceae bacterium]